MTCREFLDTVEDPALGGADAARAKALREHAAACPACAERLAGMEALDARLKGLRETFTPSPGLLERIRSTVLSTDPAAASGRPAPSYIRLWRWAPAAAALLFVVFFAALFLAGPGPAVPPLIADTLAAYEGIASGSRSLDVASVDPEAIRSHFNEIPALSVPEPRCCDACTCPPGGCHCTLKGACSSNIPSAGGRTPCVVYDHGGTPLAMLHIGTGRLADEVLAEADRVNSLGHPVYCFRHRGVTVAFCPTCDPSTLWVSRLDTGTLLAASHAMMKGKPAE
jgi:hypothetical protein